jgi:hypothetical protein
MSMPMPPTSPLPPVPKSSPLSSLLPLLESDRDALRRDLEDLRLALKQGYITSREYGLRSDDIHSRLFDLQKAIDAEVRMVKFQMAKQVLMYQQRMVFGPDVEPDKPALPEETAFGEVLGHRVWRFLRFRAHGCAVTSCYRTDYIWTPQHTEEEKASLVRDHNSFGFHAWSNPNRAVGYAMGLGLGVVIGRVKLWGVVIHHQHGYRAQYAKIVGFDYVAEEACAKDDQTLADLRKTYGLEVTP